METFEERKYSRHGSLNLISYNCLDNDNNIIGQGMGRTLNISEGGLLLETHISIETNHIMSLSIGLDDDMVTVNGKVAYCNEGKEGKFETGIEFMDADKSASRVLNKYIVAFKKQYCE